MTLNPGKPWAGLESIHYCRQTIDSFRILQVHAPFHPSQDEQIAECYTRAQDLIATYQQTNDRTVRPQLYWRFVTVGLHDQVASGIELVAAMQTSLMDSDPGLHTTSLVPAVEAWRLADDSEGRYEQVWPTADGACFIQREDGPGLVLFRIPHGEFSYVEMVHPADFVSGRLLATGQNDVQTELSLYALDERLEKGVIRKGRIRSMFVPRDQDQELATHCYQDLKSAVPPLTT